MASALVEIARQVRKATLTLLHVPDPAWLTWSAPGTSNHILWHGGHALWLQDQLTIKPLTGQSQLPPGWTTMFGQGSEPGAVPTWPSDGEVRDRLGAQVERIAKLLLDHAGEIEHWATGTNKETWGMFDEPLVGMIHGWHDEARHQGEMYLLHKLLRARQ
jgi:hypothetical protein